MDVRESHSLSAMYGQNYKHNKTGHASLDF